MNTKRVAVVYHTITGTTKQLAEAVLDGVNSIPGVEGTEVLIDGQHIVEGRYVNLSALDRITDASGVIFGSPTFMGGVSAQFKAFADASSDLWTEMTWSGKIAGGFTIGSNLSGDQLATIQYMHVLASQHGMIWTSIDIPGGYDASGRNRLGAQSGLIAHSEDGEVHLQDIETAKYLGARVAKIVKVMGDHSV